MIDSFAWMQRSDLQPPGWVDQDVLEKMKGHFLPLHGVPLPPFAGVVTTLPPYSQHDEALWRALRVVIRLLELLYVY